MIDGMVRKLSYTTDQHNVQFNVYSALATSAV